MHYGGDIGGGGAGGCRRVPAADFSVGGDVRSLGLALVAVSFSPVMGDSCVYGLDVGLAGGSVCGQLSSLGETG